MFLIDFYYLYFITTFYYHTRCFSVHLINMTTFKLEATFVWTFRFMSKRRLLLISAPSEDDYSFQQQLSALSGQECHLGL